MDRKLTCSCHTFKIVVLDIGPCTSQHAIDGYTPSHILHGFLLYALLRAFRLRYRDGVIVAVVIEAMWEVVENSPMIIERYRQTTIARDYSGDSVLNSIADVFWMTVGFNLAYRLSFRTVIGLASILEIGMLIMIRDGFLLSMLMLVIPFDPVQG